MGPFELMDFIGNDVNYAVTESVFTAFYFDPRYKPSFTQKRYSEAGFLGRKSGRGYYKYDEGIAKITPNEDNALGDQIFERILIMLINEAADAVEPVSEAAERGAKIFLSEGCGACHAVRGTDGPDKWPGPPLDNPVAMAGKGPSFIQNNFELRYGQDPEGDRVHRPVH